MTTDTAEARKLLECLRCGHKWFANRGYGKRPKTCPNPDCRSTVWDKAKAS